MNYSFNICAYLKLLLASTHHHFISVGSLTSKLNPSALASTMKPLVCPLCPSISKLAFSEPKPPFLLASFPGSPLAPMKGSSLDGRAWERSYFPNLLQSNLVSRGELFRWGEGRTWERGYLQVEGSIFQAHLFNQGENCPTVHVPGANQGSFSQQPPSTHVAPYV